jgi:hypothetical protein
VEAIVCWSHCTKKSHAQKTSEQIEFMCKKAAIIFGPGILKGGFRMSYLSQEGHLT